MWWWALACSGERAAVEEVVVELCRWGQLAEFTPAVLPETVALPALVREADLRFAAQETQREASKENPFLALQQTVGLVAGDQAKALAQAVANHATCEVEVVVEGTKATARVERTAPEPLSGEDPFVRANELGKLGPIPAQVAAIEGWIASDPKLATNRYDVTVDKVGDRWMVNFGLPEKVIAVKEAELAEAEAVITEGRAAQAILSRIEVVSAAYFPRASARVSIPMVTITARNGLDQRVLRVDFRGTVTSPDKPEPWVKGELSHAAVLDAFDPGDVDTWEIVSRLPQEWRTRAPEGSVVTLTPIRAFDMKNNLIASSEKLEDALLAAENARKEIERLRSTYLSGSPAPAPAG